MTEEEIKCRYCEKGKGNDVCSDCTLIFLEMVEPLLKQERAKILRELKEEIYNHNWEPEKITKSEVIKIIDKQLSRVKE